MCLPAIGQFPFRNYILDEIKYRPNTTRVPDVMYNPVNDTGAKAEVMTIMVCRHAESSAEPIIRTRYAYE
jgi:hypothetical protein